ncbi:MAG: ACT domain-containing protein [Dehalococcoidia bacterium]|nr:ACT domain-containing protein [Dehalococcoidia bacterium]
MDTKGRTLSLLPDIYAVCRLDRRAPVPDWATRGLFSSVTRTAAELSVVCPDALVPAGVRKESGWRVLMVEGPLDFSLTGVLASLTGPLAREGISVFALSTYDTDYLLVKQEQCEKALQALRAAGYHVAERCSAQREEDAGVVRRK